MAAQERPPLILTWHGHRAVLDAQHAVLSLGLGGASALQLRGRYTSRRHATIEQRAHCCVLVDHSTNGSFVQTEDDRVVFVRRGRVRLWGDGWISLGEPLSEASAIRFRYG